MDSILEAVKSWMKEWQFWFALVSIVGGAFTIRKYFDNRVQQDFENYHKLIERINKTLGGDKNTFLHVQCASIFELRYYRHYRKLTERLLQDLLEKWKDYQGYEEIKKEINDTLKYLNKWYRREWRSSSRKSKRVL